MSTNKGNLMRPNSIKHKPNLSVDHSTNQNGSYTAMRHHMTPGTVGHNKHISVQGLPFDKNARLTPGGGKAQTSMKNYEETDLTNGGGRFFQ